MKIYSHDAFALSGQLWHRYGPEPEKKAHSAQWSKAIDFDIRI